MKSVLDMAKKSEKSTENNALDMIIRQLIKDTIKLVEQSLEEAASFGRNSWENRIRESTLEAVYS